MKVKIKPLITEKSMMLTGQNVYTFKVGGTKVKKTRIKEIIRKKYKVDVLKINTINIKGKKNWQKVIVKIKEGQKIEGFGEKNEQ